VLVGMIKDSILKSRLIINGAITHDSFSTCIFFFYYVLSKGSREIRTGLGWTMLWEFIGW